MQSSNKFTQTKREYNEDDPRNQRLARGSRTSRKQSTKSRAVRARQLTELRRQAQARRASRQMGRALSAGTWEK